MSQQKLRAEHSQHKVLGTIRSRRSPGQLGADHSQLKVVRAPRHAEDQDPAWLVPLGTREARGGGEGAARGACGAAARTWGRAPDTLRTKSNLAVLLPGQGKHAIEHEVFLVRELVGVEIS